MEYKKKLQVFEKHRHILALDHSAEKIFACQEKILDFLPSIFCQSCMEMQALLWNVYSFKLF